MRTKKNKLSISDIAKSTGVSVTTVSFILNGKAEERRISSSVARRVSEYTKRVGYVPNTHAKKLDVSGDKEEVIALLVDDLYESKYKQSLERFVALANAEKLSLIQVSHRGDLVELDRQIGLLFDMGVRRYVICEIKDGEDSIQKLRKNNASVVVLNGNPKSEDNYVVIDFKTITSSLLNKMVDGGEIKRVGYVSLLSGLVSEKSSLDGYMDVMDKLGYDMLVRKIPLNVGSEERRAILLDFVKNNNLDAIVLPSYTLLLDLLEVESQNSLGLSRIGCLEYNEVYKFMSKNIIAIPFEEEIAIKLFEGVKSSLK